MSYPPEYAEMELEPGPPNREDACMACDKIECECEPEPERDWYTPKQRKHWRYLFALCAAILLCACEGGPQPYYSTLRYSAAAYPSYSETDAAKALNETLEDQQAAIDSVRTRLNDIENGQRQ